MSWWVAEFKSFEAHCTPQVFANLLEQFDSYQQQLDQLNYSAPEVSLEDLVLVAVISLCTIFTLLCK